MKMPGEAWFKRMVELERNEEVGAGVPDLVGPRVVRLCVVGVVYRDDRFLLGRRKQKDSAHNKYVFPGGGVLYGESLIGAVKREVKEETGLDIEVGNLLFIKEHFGDNQHNVILFYYAKAGLGEPIGNSDLADPRFYSLDAALALDLSNNAKDAILAHWA